MNIYKFLTALVVVSAASCSAKRCKPSTTASPTATPAPVTSLPTTTSPTMTPKPTTTANATSPSNATSNSTASKERNSKSSKLTAYFAQWGVGQGYYVKNIDTSGAATNLNVLNYAFGMVSDNKCDVTKGDPDTDFKQAMEASNSVDGTADKADQPLKGNFNQLKKLKAKYPDLKVVISLGGGTGSDGFYSAVRPENREGFVKSCIDAYIKGNLPGGDSIAAGVFDGIDIDFEFPGVCGNNPNCGASDADKENLSATVAEFRKQLDAVRPGLLLTAAVSSSAETIAHYDIAALGKTLDQINVMTYDFHGSWEGAGPTAFHSPLFAWPGMKSSDRYTSDSAVQLWKNGGAPASKLQLGIGFYGRGWTGVKSKDNNGLNQDATGPAKGSSEPGVEDYKVLSKLGYQSFVSKEAKTAWVFDGTTFWSFDTPETIAMKMAYVKEQGLGGAFSWALHNDDATGSLQKAMQQGLA